ncbi:CHAD domain-containing protein [Paraburkholderia sp. GAS42]|jgi:CHAD domain-containing protein|uniref:CHAD domain-containing protein n=1 Tax=Paraburkholderia sp. GAS42 TaxID=3035135 RepID=UPI003D1E9E8A
MKRDETSGQGSGPEPQGDAAAAFSSLASPLVDEAIAFAAELGEDADPESFHKLRVSLRRLRSLWWAYSPLLDKDSNTRQRALFKYLATAAGKTRDWDILLQLLSDEIAAESASSSELRAARAQALATSRETLSNANVKDVLRETLSSSTKALNTAHDRVSIRKFAERRVSASEKALRKRMKRAARAKQSDYASFHEVRKAGKKLRYLLDLFGPVLRDKHRQTIKRLKKLQKRFGALNDVVASEALLGQNADLFAGSGARDSVLQWLEKERKRRLRSAGKLLRDA